MVIKIYIIFNVIYPQKIIKYSNAVVFQIAHLTALMVSYILFYTMPEIVTIKKSCVDIRKSARARTLQFKIQ